MAMSLTREAEKTFTYLNEVEELAQDIITLKEHKLELSNALNKLNEAFRAAQKSEEYETIYIKIADLYFMMPSIKCRPVLQKEIVKVKDQYVRVSEEIKKKVVQLRDLEYRQQIKGIGLKPLSYKEATGLLTGFGIKKT